MTPRDNVPGFYDVEPLAAWLQAGVPVITPNYRLARQIKLAWGQRRHQAGKASWKTPLVLSLEHWWLHCRRLADPWSESGIRLATPAQELELWQRCIKNNPASGNLLRPRGAAQLARDAYHSLLLWQLDWRREPLSGDFCATADTALFVQWAQQFEQLLAAAGLELLPAQVPELARQVSRETVVLAEFGDLPPLYARALREQATELHRHQHRAEPAHCSLQPCRDSEQELYMAAHWARAAVLDKPNASVAILLHDPAAERHRFERILREVFEPRERGEGEGNAGLPVNFSGGVPLSSTATVRTALALLSLPDQAVAVEPLVQLLHSRYRDQSEAEAEIQLIRKLYQHARASISVSRLRYFSRDLGLGKQLLKLSQRRELQQKHPPSRWRALFADCLQILQWPGNGPLDSAEYQQLEHWHRCLEQMAELDGICAPLNYTAARSLLHQLCADTLFQVQTGAAPIQVLGLLEAAGLQFQQMWLCGMSSSEWPASAQPNPFIPFRLQQHKAMPHADSQREHRYALGLLEQYRHSCGQLLASFAETRDQVEQQPSRLLKDFTRLPPAAVCGLPGSWLACAALPLELLSAEDRAPTVTDLELANLQGGSGLLQDQSQCGFRAFARHRLRVHAPGELAVALTPADRGSLLHDALFELWGELGDSATLRALDAAALKPRIEAAVDYAIAAFTRFHAETIGKTYMELERSRLCQLLQQWLQVEAQRRDFVVQAREQDCELQLGRLHLQLRIDRVDLLADGEQLIIDYKSASGEVRHWLGARPRQPQLPLYSEALGAAVGGISFAVVNADGAGYCGLARNDQGAGIRTDIGKATAGQAQVLSDWQALRQHWQGVLQDLARQFIDGEARVDPRDPQHSCRWCGLQALCRIGEVANRERN